MFISVSIDSRVRLIILFYVGEIAENEPVEVEIESIGSDLKQN